MHAWCVFVCVCDCIVAEEGGQAGGRAFLCRRTNLIMYACACVCARVKSMLSGFCFPNGVDLNESIQARARGACGAGLHYYIARIILYTYI